MKKNPQQPDSSAQLNPPSPAPGIRRPSDLPGLTPPMHPPVANNAATPTPPTPAQSTPIQPTPAQSAAVHSVTPASVPSPAPFKPQRIPVQPPANPAFMANQPQGIPSPNQPSHPTNAPLLTESGRAAWIPQPKPKKRFKFRWYDAVIGLLILCLLGFALFRLISPRVILKEQKRISSELLALTPVDKPIQELSGGLYVDPQANKVEGEAWEVFAQGQEPSSREPVWIQPVARLEIDAIDLNFPILDKAGLVELRYGIGHYPSSANLFGDHGISVLFGHHMFERGHYFNRLDEVKNGDTVRVTGNGKEYLYTVDKRVVVNPEELIPLLKQDSNEKYLLMITCTNPPSFEKRLLVYAKLSSEQPLQPAQP